MKRVLSVVLTLMLVLPLGVMAKNTNTYYSKYNTLNFVDTLTSEDIEVLNENYEENDKQINIYMFRGQGCGYCKKFLNFLNSISEEYGKYFKLVSFEVWQDSANSELLSTVAEKMGEEAGGVPYIIIGDKVFPGYAEDYDDQIKETIVNLYNTKKADRYDIFEELNKKNTNNAIVGIGATVIIVGIVAAAIITRKNNG